MRKKYFQYLLLLCMILSVLSCAKENRWDCVKRTGDEIKEMRKLDDFTSMEVNSNFTIILIQDTINEAHIEAGKNLISLIETDVSDGKLTLQNKNKCNWSRSYADNIEIYLHVKTLIKIEVNACCNIINTNIIQQDNLLIEIAQNTVAHLNLNLNTIKLEFMQHSGSGTYIFKGYSTNAYYYQKGAGQINASNLETDVTHVVNKSSGDVHVNVQSTLKIEYTGSGNVYYKGNPAKIEYTEEHNKGRLIKEE